MPRFISLLKIWSNRLGFMFNGRKVDFGTFHMIKPYDAVNSFMADVQTSGVKASYISDLAIQIVYEGLLVSQKVRSDFTDGLYFRMEDELHIPYHSLTFKVMEHIAQTYRKAFGELDAAFISPSFQIRYVLKCMNKRPHCYFTSSLEEISQQLPLAFKKKKVLLLSDHPDLFQVQFARLKTQAADREKYNYSLLALDPMKFVMNTDRSLFFESLDAISMAILNYSFDVILIHSDVYSLALVDFLNKLEVPTLVIDDSVYGMYGIVKKHDELSHNGETNCLCLEDYDRETRIDFQAVTSSKKLPDKKSWKISRK